MTWNADFDWWEFSDGTYDYMLSNNPVFDSEVLSQLADVHRWVQKLNSEIDNEIKRHLEDWCDWKEKKQLVVIDVSRLVDQREIDVSYAEDDWGDLGINIMMKDGKITDSYAGD